MATTYEYSNWDRFQPTTIVTKPPKVEADQNGSGSFEPTTNTYDDFGHMLTTQTGNQKTQNIFDTQGFLTKPSSTQTVGR